MKSFARWYTTQLKTRPMTANLASAFVLMAAGDIMAQEIEIKHINLKDDKEQVQAERQVDPSKKVRFRRYGTLSPNVQDIQRRSSIRREKDYYGSENWPQKLVNFRKTMEEEFQSIDLFRTATMVAWSVCVYSPFYVWFYRGFSRWLPLGNGFKAVSLRVGLSFLSSMPMNALFFCYGTMVHHVVEWITLSQRERLDPVNYIEGARDQFSGRSHAFDFEKALDSVKMKLEAELPSTIKTSASVWIPLNILNFSIMPVYLQPVTLMGCSAFWNCYLSLAQHRET